MSPEEKRQRYLLNGSVVVCDFEPVRPSGYVPGDPRLNCWVYPEGKPDWAVHVKANSPREAVETVAERESRASRRRGGPMPVVEPL